MYKSANAAGLLEVGNLLLPQASQRIHSEYRQQPRRTAIIFPSHRGVAIASGRSLNKLNLCISGGNVLIGRIYLIIA